MAPHSEKTTNKQPDQIRFVSSISSCFSVLLVVDHPGSVGASPSEQIGWSFTVACHRSPFAWSLLSFPLQREKGSVMKKKVTFVLEIYGNIFLRVIIITHWGCVK